MQKLSTQQRLAVATLEELRNLERNGKRKQSENGTLDYIIKFHKLIRKLDKELYLKIQSQLNAD